MAAVWAIVSNLGPYIPSFVDSPEMRGLHADVATFSVVCGLLSWRCSPGSLSSAGGFSSISRELGLGFVDMKIVEVNAE